MDNSNKTELIIKSLQQRIGEIVSQYETHIAILRAEITQLSDELEKVTSGLANKKNTKE
jgi:uncharacterized small protein (DUF1192 family)